MAIAELALSCAAVMLFVPGDGLPRNNVLREKITNLRGDTKPK